MKASIIAVLLAATQATKLHSKNQADVKTGQDYYEQAGQIIEQYDSSDGTHKGLITIDEAMAANPSCVGECLDDLKLTFDSMDADGSGMIDRDELEQFLKDMSL